ncbi:S1 domain-containing post-transcriptional regulator GSP13 [Fervidibacillus halotolerans]|uniref:S1 domain-containing post-transcriptional regulator GSP13 n=1 Tax=Fervidibacillus halotolerans TaxID=2980027 RepID=A0A9E8RWJ3_9BACI|nr:S1 domain-containing post-transcriptional regulator GSP13 [Fervidibacillus halotolerans]WAA11820.1 S1 domain-containing post-transcriptional regulator GSP13 [Fervidibacillus halotolerans]
MVDLIQAGMVVKGRVTGIQSYGAFVSIGNNQQGLIHISEITDRYVQNIRDYVNVGDEVTVKVLSVDEKSGKISLSLKALEEENGTMTIHLKKTGKTRLKENPGDHGFEPLKEKLKEWIEQSGVKRTMKK